MTRRLLSAMFLAVAISAFVLPAAYGQAKTTDTLDVEVPSVVGRSVWMGHTDPNRLLHVSVSLNPANAAGLQAFADDVCNPNSPIYRHFLTPEEVGAQFGQPEQAVN